MLNDIINFNCYSCYREDKCFHISHRLRLLINFIKKTAFIIILEISVKKENTLHSIFVFLIIHSIL